MIKNKLKKIFALLVCIIICVGAFAIPAFAAGNPNNPGSATGYHSMTLNAGYYQFTNEQWREYLGSEDILYNMYEGDTIIEFNRCFSITETSYSDGTGAYYQSTYYNVPSTEEIVTLTVGDMMIREFEGEIQCQYTINVYVNNTLIWASAWDANSMYGDYPPITISWAVSVPARPSSTIIGNAVFLSAIDTNYNDTSKSYKSGYDDGHRIGLIEGEAIGGANSFDSGYSAGYAAGVAEGAANAELREGTFSSFFSAILFTPFNVFQQMLDFDFLGTNLGNAVIGIFTVLAVLAIVVMIWKAWRG